LTSQRADTTRTHAVTFANVLIELNRKDVPELGTRPVYFHRRKLSADTTPEQFWGFFSFNQDPFGPTGLTVRLSGESSLKGRIVSESLPPDPPDYKQRFKTFEMYVSEPCSRYLVREVFGCIVMVLASTRKAHTFSSAVKFNA
jgi:hypothetical protein